MKYDNVLSSDQVKEISDKITEISNGPIDSLALLKISILEKTLDNSLKNLQRQRMRRKMESIPIDDYVEL